ncbi:hypothetical protein HB943_13600 [Listeria weihenstephanensis]|uniref:DUF4352 domain-containing protein n=1 Tax=Listeria weihenstephanensis TaxID=1006155 RepID=A0A841ZAU6_9LIST|nr:hypothetical protein [Listeria weihenstephanensis]MBC1501636.1 hypothetical protein [Listeria weihenstephanensis]
MKRIMTLMCMVMVASITLLGCSNTDDTKKNEDSKQETTKKNEIKADSKATYGFKDVVDADGLRIEFTKAELLEAEGKKDSILKLSFELTNPTADKKGFTAINLEVKNKEGDLLDVYPGENYGKEIETGTTDKGAGYFMVKGSAPFKVTYIDPDHKEVTATWELALQK